jgi:predicted choloylglycine hydrolase
LQKRIPLFIYKKLFAAIGKKFLKYHSDFFQMYQKSQIHERVLGLAQGLEMSPAFVYGLCALEVTTSELPHRPQLGCTSLAFEGTRTQAGTPLIAYNHDFPESFGPYLMVRRNEPKSGFASLNLTYPISLGCIAGVNEKGLAITINHAFEKTVEKNQAALFVTCLLQECLDHCENVDEAIDLILTTPTTNGSMLTLVDASGKRAVVEVSSRKRILRKATTGLLSTFNKYQEAELEKIELPLHTVGTKMFKGRLVHEHNIERPRRFAEVFDPEKIYSDDAIRELLSDHDGADGGAHTICRHHKDTSSTLASVLIKSKEKEMKVIFGPACQGEYQRFVL